MTEAVHVLIYLLFLTMGLAAIAPCYRGLLVFSGQKTADSFPRRGHDGPAWYLRVMDAHANAIENLPLYIALFIAATVAGQLAVVDEVAYYYLAARLGQSLVHVIGVNHYLVLARFTFWLAQLALLTYTAAQLLLA